MKPYLLFPAMLAVALLNPALASEGTMPLSTGQPMGSLSSERDNCYSTAPQYNLGTQGALGLTVAAGAAGAWPLVAAGALVTGVMARDNKQQWDQCHSRMTADPAGS
ncbi:hypothetical protein [Ferrimonas marina]|uniref:Uncharacterized protein n=1 Tax=Ferrimonas marina TaxID=299255 RepID=A0A1M5MV96_9GAMM|nr:hypothetical protein [Ferrimonas marina]SHG81052.1 hypothetical protein SAMN02745129_0789 [Ferrimonas marina]